MLLYPFPVSSPEPIAVIEFCCWITSSLYGGYAAANVLKWIWWRFNGFGYFWGMMAGLASSTLKLVFFPEITDIYFFPAILAFSFVGCFLGSLLTEPDTDEVLMKFYKNVKPWGFWKPVYDKVVAIDPTFEKNRDFKSRFSKNRECS